MIRLSRCCLPALALVASLALAATGCGPLVGVKATIRTDEMTRLEEEALGERGELGLAAVLLPLHAPGAEQEWADLDRRHADLIERLARVEPKTPALRAWETIALHNRGVLRARLGDAAEAGRLLADASARAGAYGLATLHWQVEFTRAELAGPEGGEGLQAAAAALADCLPLEALDYQLESPAFRDALYGSLVAQALPADPEGALGCALQWDAVELARAVWPDGIALPAGERADMVAAFEAARRRAADLRRERCARRLESLVGAEVLTATAEYQALRDAAEKLRSASALGGLTVPDVADPLALQEALGQGTALLMYVVLPDDDVAGFALTQEGLQAATIRLQWAGLPLVRDAAQASELLLGPFAEALAGAERVYVACPAELQSLPWAEMPVGGAALAGRLDVAFLASVSDLVWGFRERRYGRETVLVVGDEPGRGAELAQALAGRPGVSEVPLRSLGGKGLPEGSLLVDTLWIGAGVSLSPQAPGQGFFAVPGGLGALGGLTIGELAAGGSRAAVACVAGLPAEAFTPEPYGSLRVLARAFFAAGVPSVACGAESADQGAFWAGFLGGLRDAPAAAALRESLARDVPPAEWGRYRLYGYAGMTASEYAELSKLDFNDTLASARAAMAAGRFEEAASHFLDLWHMGVAVPFASEGQRNLVLANIQQYLVQCWQSLGQFGLAASHQQLRIERLAESGQAPPAAMALEYQSLGALLTRAERFEEAASAYDESLALMREHGGEEDVARVLGELGKSLDRAAEYDKALETFQEALGKYRALQQEGGIGLQHVRIGTIYLKRLNNAVRAEEEFRQALDAYGQAGDADGVLEATVDVGLCRRQLGDLTGAIESFDRAREQAAAEGLRRDEARALTEIANTRWYRGEYQQALELVTQSSEIARAEGDDFQLNVNYQLVALIYWELNDYDRAHQALDTAIEAAQRAESPLDVASAYNNHGIVYRRQERYEDALRSFDKALDMDRRLQSRWGQAYDHRNVGMTLQLMGRLDVAEPNLERAVELSRAIGDRVNLAKSLLALGDLRLAQGRAEQARSLYEEALGEARAVYLPEVEWRALWGRGRVSKAAGDAAGAWEAYRQAIEIVETLQAAVKIEEFRSAFMANKGELYEDAVELLLDAGRSEEAFHYAERSRARRFLDVVAAVTPDLKTDRERELFARQQELAARLRGVHEALAREETESGRQQLGAELARLQQQYADTLLDLRVANPALSGFVMVQAATAADVERFRPEGVTLIAYFCLPKSLVIWVWSPAGFTTRRVDVERDALTERIRQFRLMVQNRELLDTVVAEARGLYDVLIRPVEDLCRGAVALGIVPHRGLHYLSFAAVHDGDAFLIERVPIFYSPSMSVLGQTLARPPLEQKRGARVLAVGNPDVGEPAYELPFTEREVESLQRDFDNVTALTRAAATEDALRERIGAFDIVHIGAHGHFDPANPLFSNLVLAPGREDGLLHLYEVTGLNISAQVLMLSACQTGLGEMGAADELVSLSRAFAYAGARTILSTLWRVDDVSTALVAKHFYRNYAEHGAAESLQQAQIQVMEDGRHAHPSYWAGVVLSGDYR